MQIVGRSVGAALAMGNACVLKPAEEACLTVLAFARIAARPACRRARSTSSPASAKKPAPRSPRIPASTTCRSPARSRPARWCRARRRERRAGDARARRQVAANRVCRCRPRRALPFLVNAGIQNAGQTCSASSRILVERPVFEEVRSAWRSATGPCGSARRRRPRRRPGDLAAPEDDRRPLPRLAATAARLAGAGRIVADAPKADTMSAPTLIAECRPTTPGPGRNLRPRPGGHRLRGRGRGDPIANGTEYGLVAGVWTPTAAGQMRLARALRAARCSSTIMAPAAASSCRSAASSIGPRPRKGLRGAVRLLGAEDDRHPPRLKESGTEGMRLEGRIAIVTGAAFGLRRGHCEEICRRGGVA